MAQAVGAGMEGASANQALKTPEMPTVTPTSFGSTGYNYTSQNQINNRFNFMSSSYQGFTYP